METCSRDLLVDVGVLGGGETAVGGDDAGVGVVDGGDGDGGGDCGFAEDGDDYVDDVDADKLTTVVTANQRDWPFLWKMIED